MKQTGRYQNHQLFCECRLVSLWNAARYYGIKPPEPGSKRYKEACEEGCCIIGACINITKEEKRLGLKGVRGKKTLQWIRRNLPVELGVRHPRRGFHSVLIVEVRKSRLLLANYTRGRLYWMDWKTMKRKIPRAPNDKVFKYRKVIK